MEKKIIIIGSEGFIGKSFVNYYKRLNDSNIELYFIDIVPVKKNNYYNVNATNFEKINKIIQKVRPDEIYNFCGSFTNIFKTDYKNNVVATKNIIESILLNNLNECKILINGSAAEYGLIQKEDSIIDEDYPLNPISFYGLSKVFQTYLAKTYFLMEDVNVYITRPFNIIGYGVSSKLFIGRLINEIKLNIKEKRKITLGNLNNERDYIDIEDLISAYVKIIHKGVPGEVYNIGSRCSIKTQNLLKKFMEIFEIDEKFIEIDKNFIRKFDIPKIIADNTKLKELGWINKITLENSIQRIKSSILGL
jgi:GDP-4-dehydro-6-deoxy-D-mannose reductase